MAARKNIKTHQELFTKLARGTAPKDALLQCGYAEAQARKGWAAVPAWIRAKLNHRAAQKLAELGDIEPTTRAQLLRGRIVKNVLEGKDKAVGSIKLGMQDKELNLLQPDSMTGAIIINTPASLADLLRPAESDDYDGPTFVGAMNKT